MTARSNDRFPPHLQTYRVADMALSIIHRGTGMALYFGPFCWPGG
jgi:succinate dehydrogenase/fumarate reductase cytochrome b subunit